MIKDLYVKLNCFAMAKAAFNKKALCTSKKDLNVRNL